MHTLSALSVSFVSLDLVSAFPRHFLKRQDVSIETTFQGYYGCSADQKATIQQAHTDGLALAEATLYRAHDLEDSYQTVDFRTQAAQDYWGPQSKNSPYQEYIVNTLIRASQNTRGWGVSDWWNKRYVDIVYCPAFFNKLKSHDYMVQQVAADTTGKMKLNVRNLRSQATTALHEWLHIKGFSSEACVGGCVDTPQQIGGDKVDTYKSGRAKLLAKRSVEQAIRTNDNYAYFATALWMKNRFGTYPQYPRAWDPSKSRKDNEAAEGNEPGAPTSVQSWELEDAGKPAEAEVESLPAVSEDVYAASAYPDWYQPALSDKDVSVPDLPDLTWALPSANGTCQTTSGSPKIDDCIHAFGSLYQFPDQSVLHGEKGGTWWAGYVQSCAIGVYYTDAWTDSCKATLGDVAAHASSLFVGCEDGGLGTVGGNVQFNVPNCPAFVQLSMTDQQTPPQGKAP